VNQNPRGQKRASGDAHHQVRGASMATSTIDAKYSELNQSKSPNPPPSTTTESDTYAMKAVSINQSYDRREAL